MSNSGIWVSIIKDILLLTVHNGRSWICGRRFFARLNDTLEKGMLRSSSTHIFDNFIGFGCEDEDNWKPTGFEGNYKIFVADIAIDRFSWQLILCNSSVVATSLLMILESAPEQKRACNVTVRLLFEILTAITCKRTLSWRLISLLTGLITASKGAWLSVDVSWSWCRRVWCFLLHSLYLTVDLQSLI